jgi:hypothetical protein
MSYQITYSALVYIIDSRCAQIRKHSEALLAPFSTMIVDCLSDDNEDHILKNILSEKIDLILDDCEIFHQMPEHKAIDALAELSNYACIYVDDEQYSHIYVKICELINMIRKSYPLYRSSPPVSPR